MILPISNVLNQAVLFKWFIDGIIWLLFDKDLMDQIREALESQFSANKLELLF